MLREAPLLPDRAVTGLLEPRIGAIGSMVTSQTGQHLCDRGRLVQFVGAATSGKVFGEALAFSIGIVAEQASDPRRAAVNRLRCPMALVSLPAR
jgi:enoyl-CoA hydratase/carnithine racemase